MLVYQYVELLTGVQSVTDDTVQLFSSSSRSRVEKKLYSRSSLYTTRPNRVPRSINSSRPPWLFLIHSRRFLLHIQCPIRGEVLCSRNEPHTKSSRRLLLHTSSFYPVFFLTHLAYCCMPESKYRVSESPASITFVVLICQVHEYPWNGMERIQSQSIWRRR